ncbi:unnamed protein product [Blepharisma stoltei]|uniref:Kelch motif family protein n=1 Tax=Blepharisma stoltei TaxID=1481888 RepID=A0AAU9J354_9CILI|nr:unnamed protein product [Blepharisma stoltei]
MVDKQYIEPGETFVAHQNDPSGHIPKLKQTFQDYIDTSSPKGLLYLIDSSHNLLIYNADSNTKEKQILETPEPLDYGTCMAQLPNGKLFFYGRYQGSGITLLIDENWLVHKLPSGKPCRWSSAIFFNNSIYCFGGKDQNDHRLPLSRRFDLDENWWIELTQMPQACFNCDSVIFNRNILISGVSIKNLLLYSIDTDSFSTIPYDFAKNKRKILINAEKKLYLIESRNRSIYESDIESYTNWRKIGDSPIDIHPFQVYWTHNKGEICIGCINYASSEYYFKFDLDKKTLVKLE